jgi:hypothetical protein
MRTIYAGQDSMTRYNELLQQAEALWQKEAARKVPIQEAAQ